MSTAEFVGLIIFLIFLITLGLIAHALMKDLRDRFWLLLILLVFIELPVIGSYLGGIV